MIENEEIPEAKAIPIPPNPAPVALYGNQDAMDDFPVLKAFQQYVDSEQAKAHKRLMSVCFFFTMLIVVIIGVFLFVVMNMRNNRSLPDGTAEMQRHLMEQTAKMNERLIQQLLAQKNTPPPSPAASVVVVGDNKEKPAVDSALNAKERELAAREAELKKREFEEAQKELIARENALKEREAKMAADLAEKAKKNSEEQAREKKRKEILEHRRKLYPEYFDENGNELAEPLNRKRESVKSQEIDPRDIEIARLKQAAEIEKLKAELAQLKQTRKAAEKTTRPARAADENDDDLAELDALLESSGVYGKKEKADSKNNSPSLPGALELDIGDDVWTIPY